MTKRLREEPEGVAINTHSNTDSEQEIKKRKIQDTKSGDNRNGATFDNLSVEEKRELKRLKKAAKKQAGSTLGDRNTEPVIKHPASKTAAAKAARRTHKEHIHAAVVPVANGVDDTEKNDALSKAAEKRRRKAERQAEKERRKALQTEDDGLDHLHVESITPNGAVPLKPTSPQRTDRRDRWYEEDRGLTALPDSEIQAFLSSSSITIKDPSSATPLRPITQFSYLPKSSQSVAFSTFKAPTAIQAAAWPFLLTGRDVIGVAETGSGKTLAFGIPCIRSVSSATSSKKSKTPARAVIISPTRELALQIHDQTEQLAAPAGLRSVCVYGGVPKEPQRLALSTAHIIVATPGRLNDLIEEKYADLSKVKYLVLDEADRMLEKGFEDAIRKIISATPSTTRGRQTLMFTATWPESVRSLAATFMDHPVRITIGDNNADGELRANNRIEQQVEVLDPRQKEQRMLQLIKQYQSGPNKNDRILVFCLYKKEATRVEGFLHSRGLRVAGIHGDLSQTARMAALEGFKKGECPLLVATDVAARGLDIPNVKLVLNVTFPLTVEDYVHRIGRYVYPP